LGGEGLDNYNSAMARGRAYAEARDTEATEENNVAAV